MLSHGIVKERFSALLTDSVRAKILLANGYSVDLMEFVGIESTPKNILIRARKSKIKSDKREEALDEVMQTLGYFKVEQTLYSLIYNEKNAN
jgi:hypothetical protein